MPYLQAHPIRKSPRKHLKDIVGTVGSLDIKQLIVQIRKPTKIGVREPKTSTRKNRVLKGTLKVKDIEICQNLCALMWGIWTFCP